MIFCQNLFVKILVDCHGDTRLSQLKAEQDRFVRTVDRCDLVNWLTADERLKFLVQILITRPELCRDWSKVLHHVEHD